MTKRTMPSSMSFPPLKEPFEYRADAISHALSNGDYDRSNNVFNDPHLKVHTPKGNFIPSRDFPSHHQPSHVEDEISGMLTKDSKIIGGDWRMGGARAGVAQWGGTDMHFPDYPPPQRHHSNLTPDTAVGVPLHSTNHQDAMKARPPPPSGHRHHKQQSMYTMFNSNGVLQRPSGTTVAPSQREIELLARKEGDNAGVPLPTMLRTQSGLLDDGRKQQQRQRPPKQCQQRAALPPSHRQPKCNKQMQHQGHHHPPPHSLQQPHQPKAILHQQQSMQHTPSVTVQPPPATEPLGPHDLAHLQECHHKSSSPPTVDWLSDHYQVAEGVSLPRSTLYAHYMDYCAKATVEAVNAASFGKIIRQVFPNLKTRRLGTRGNSKYHYYGIRHKSSSTLNEEMPLQDKLNGDAKPRTPQEIKTETMDNVAPPHPPTTASARSADASSASSTTPEAPTLVPVAGPGQQQDGRSRVRLYQLPGAIAVLTPAMASAGVTLESVNAFRVVYHKHCQLLLDNMLAMAFGVVQQAWMQFWVKDYKESYNRILGCHEVIAMVEGCDRMLYDTALSSLLPDVLKVYPMLTAQAIRGFSKSLEEWCKTAMEGKPESIVTQKTRTIKSFAHYLRRYTSLNHLAQAARAVLGSHFQVQSMVSDLSRVDFPAIKDQMEWICQGRSRTLTAWHNDFVRLLRTKVSLEEWVKWLSGIVQSELRERGPPHDNHVELARQFLMQWSFYSSLIIRDLTLRSAQTFGSFHLIRLLFDEYVLYKVEKQLAEITIQPVLGSTMGFIKSHTKAAFSSSPVVASALGVLGGGRIGEHSLSEKEAAMSCMDDGRTPSSSTTSSTLSLHSAGSNEHYGEDAEAERNHFPVKEHGFLKERSTSAAAISSMDMRLASSLADAAQSRNNALGVTGGHPAIPQTIAVSLQEGRKRVADGAGRSDANDEVFESAKRIKTSPTAPALVAM